MFAVAQVRQLVGARQLIGSLLRQDLKLKYGRSRLGPLWTVLSPLSLLVVLSIAFSFVFSRQYPLHLFATLLPWQCFQSVVTDGCRALTGSHALILQWNVPKAVLPFRKVLFRVVEYGFSLLALASVAWIFGFRLSPALAVLPFSIAVLFLTAFGLATLCAVATVYFRDLEHVIASVMRAWFYLTPVIVPFEHLPEKYKWVFALNPMYYVLEMFDAPIARAEWPSADAMGMAVLVAGVSSLLGLALLDRYQDDLNFHL